MAFFSYTMWRTTDKQREIAENQLSAYGAVESATVAVARLEMDLANPGGGAIRIWLTNTGHRPASKVVVYTQTTPYGRNVPITEEYGSFEVGNTVLPPGKDEFPIFKSLKLTETQTAQLKTGKAGLLLSGQIAYDNGFDKEQMTGLCFFYEARNPQRWGRCTPRINYKDRADLEKQIKELEELQRKHENEPRKIG